jgi:hypothetical protein
VPITEKQLAANRANAAKSTGPQRRFHSSTSTPEGKARSACNARAHGFTGSTFAVARLEDLQEVAHLRTDLIAVYQPVNSQELFALERMALTQQTILRAARLESGLFINCLDLALNDNGTAIAPMSRDLVGDGDIEITRAQNRNYALAGGFHRMALQPNNTWSLFLRYQAQAERNYRRAVEEFDRLKRLRPELPNEAILEVPPEENKPASAPQDEPISPNPEPVAALPSRARKQAVPISPPQPNPELPANSVSRPSRRQPRWGSAMRCPVTRHRGPVVPIKMHWTQAGTLRGLLRGGRPRPRGGPCLRLAPRRTAIIRVQHTLT